MSAMKKNLWQAIKFTLFSISAGVIQAGSYTLFYEVFGWTAYWQSHLPSLILSVLWNFTFNRRYTFRSAGNVPKAMALVAAYYCVFTPLSTLGGNFLANLGWNEYLITGLNMVVNFVTEFLYDKYVVFRGTVDTNSLANPAEDR